MVYKLDDDFSMMIGKIVKSISRVRREYSYEGAGDIVSITFTDGTVMEIESFDYEGYSSAMEVTITNV